MEHLRIPPEHVSTDHWFKQQSLLQLAEQLSQITYPGYPVMTDRYLLPADSPLDFTIPDGTWTIDYGAPDSTEHERLSALGLKFDSYGRPLHPWLKEMISSPSIGTVCGKGFYWNWGPNYTADPIVLRHDLQEPHVLLIQRGDTGQWALPGGFVDETDSSALETALREGFEETGLDVSWFDPHITPVYKGPLADIRSTAHAWGETTAIRFDLPSRLTECLTTMDWEGNDDAQAAAWIPLSRLNLCLFGSHKLLIALALEL